MEVIITRLTPYQERDYIVNGLTSEGFITFKAVGTLKPTSSSASHLMLYGLVDVELKETKAGATLTHIKPLFSSIKLFARSEKLTFLSLIGEVVSKVVKDENEVKEIFLLVKETLLYLEKTNNEYSLLFLFIAQLLKKLGLGFKIDGCVYCGRKDNIVGVSFSEGGFVCGTCQKGETQILNKHEIDVFRYAFMINERQLNRHEFSREEVKKFIIRLLFYIEETYNLSFSTKELIFS